MQDCLIRVLIYNLILPFLDDFRCNNHFPHPCPMKKRCFCTIFFSWIAFVLLSLSLFFKKIFLSWFRVYERFGFKILCFTWRFLTFLYACFLYHVTVFLLYSSLFHISLYGNNFNFKLFPFSGEQSLYRYYQSSAFDWNHNLRLYSYNLWTA